MNNKEGEIGFYIVMSDKKEINKIIYIYIILK